MFDSISERGSFALDSYFASAPIELEIKLSGSSISVEIARLEITDFTVSSPAVSLETVVVCNVPVVEEVGNSLQTSKLIDAGPTTSI